MVLQLEEPEIVHLDEFVVAGVAHRGSEVDETQMWIQLDDYRDELRDAAVGTESYGVFFEIDEGGEEFTFVAGPEVEDVGDLSADLTGVDIPEGDYAVFDASDADLSDEIFDLRVDDVIPDDRERVPRLIFQRFLGDDPIEPSGRSELFVPLADE